MQQGDIDNRVRTAELLVKIRQEVNATMKSANQIQSEIEKEMQNWVGEQAN